MEKEDDKQTNKEFWGVLFDHIPEKSLIRPRSSDSRLSINISDFFSPKLVHACIQRLLSTLVGQCHVVLSCPVSRSDHCN